MSSDPACRGPQGPPGQNGKDGAPGTNGTNGTNGAPGPAGGLGGYEIKSNQFTGKEGGTVHCTTGKRVLGGGAEIIQASGRFSVLASRPNGQSGWTVELQRVTDKWTDAPGAHDDVAFFVGDEIPVINVWAICATATT